MYFFHGDGYRAVFYEIETVLNKIAGRETVFLHPEEITFLESLRTTSNRRSWLAGRICAKILWLSVDDIDADASWKTLRIVSRDERGRGSRPILFENEKPVGRELSLSHSDLAVLAVLSDRTDARIGCDLTSCGSVNRGMITLFFPERNDLSPTDDLADRFWAVKEAAYKAAGNDGEAFAPAQWRVVPCENDRFLCRGPASQEVVAETSIHQGHVVAVAVYSSPAIEEISKASNA